MRQDRQAIANADVRDRHVLEAVHLLPMRERWDPARQRAQDRGGLRHRVLLQRLSTSQHQHDDRAGEVFVEKHRSDDRHAREVIGAELAVKGAPPKSHDEGRSRDREDGDQRGGRRRRAGDVSQNEVNEDADERQQRRHRMAVRPEPPWQVGVSSVQWATACGGSSRFASAFPCSTWIVQS